MDRVKNKRGRFLIKQMRGFIVYKFKNKNIEV